MYRGISFASSLKSCIFPFQSFASARSSLGSSQAGDLNDSFRISEDGDATDTSTDYPSVSQLSDDVFMPPTPETKPEKRPVEEVRQLGTANVVKI